MTEQDDDFATLFEASIKTTRFKNGQTIEGTIVAIGPEVAFINVGGKGEAVIAVNELTDADGTMEAAVGDRIQAVVVSTEGGLTLSRKMARGAASARQLEDAFHARLPVEGKVEKPVKGGYEVRIAGLRAFCPLSQIDTIRDTDPASHEGKVYTFRITEYKDGGKNLVVSRRAILEEEQRANAVEVRKAIVPGAIITGRVTSVVPFGAFVDLGSGVQGLLHVSEMGWSRVDDTSKIAAPGDTITVAVLRVDADTQKIALGLKQLSDDPWSAAGTTYAVGQTVPGRITRLADFGAFVELEPGIEGLAHSSTFVTNGSERWTRSAVVGLTGPFEILSIDLDKKRIGVALVAEGSARSRQRAASQEAAQEAAEVREYTERKPASSGEGFGSLAGQLRGILDSRK